MYSFLLKKVLTISNSCGFYLHVTCAQFDSEKQMFSYVPSKRSRIKTVAVLQLALILWVISRTAHTYFFKPKSEFPLPYILGSLYITLNVVFLIEFQNLEGYSVAINQIYFYLFYFKSQF